MALSVSRAAKFQILQTRAKLGATLWTNAIVAVPATWLGIALWFTHHETGQLHYQYWWYWTVGGIITRTPLLNMLAPHLPIRAHGRWYRLVNFTAWVDGLYHGSFVEYFWRYAIRTALIPIGVGVFAIVWRARHRVDAEHLRGLRLLTPREHDRQLNGGVVTRLYRNGTTTVDGIKLGSIVIPARLTLEHFLLTGSPGSGKSTLLRHLLTQIQERRQRVVVNDPEGEFAMEFYNPDRGDIILNPLDQRFPFWSPFLEFRDNSFSMDAEAMASSLIRGNSHLDRRIFPDSARTLIESIFEVVTDRSSAAGIAEFLDKRARNFMTASNGNASICTRRRDWSRHHRNSK